MVGDLTYGDAILDRLLHNAYRLVMKGKSMRGPDMRPETEKAYPGVPGNPISGRAWCPP
jgi:hypothetical protein